MNWSRINRWLEQHGLELEESFYEAYKDLAGKYKAEHGYSLLSDVYALTGITKQQLSYWAAHPCSTQTKDLFRYRTILNAGRVFGLNAVETELLANKAGLSVCRFLQTALQEGETPALPKPLPVRHGRLLAESNVTERMLQYIRNGMRPTKETLLAISISLGYSLEEIQEALKIYGYFLSPSLPNDTVVLYVLDHGNGPDGGPVSVWQINSILEDLELPLLGTRFLK